MKLSTIVTKKQNTKKTKTFDEAFNNLNILEAMSTFEISMTLNVGTFNEAFGNHDQHIKHQKDKVFWQKNQ